MGLNLYACADLATNPAHCGACSNACAAGERCIAGQCRGFLYASGCWECGDGNEYPVCCTVGSDKLCLPAGTACP
jgi:hypothetical protein